MSRFQVAVPISRRRVQIHVDKGQPWSVAEHLILEAIARGTQSIDDLEGGFALPRRVVIEAVIRLMRVGWVDMNTGFALCVTSDGALALEKSELPSLERRISRPAVYLCDRIAGHIFRNRELRSFEEKRLRERAKQETIHWLEPRLHEGDVRFSELADVLLDHDEQWVGADMAGESSVGRFALVSVVDGVVQGLPHERSLEALREAILRAVQETSTGSSIAIQNASPLPHVCTATDLVSHPVEFRPDDLLLGGEAHLRAFEHILKSAVTRIVVHSTFLSEATFTRFLPMMLQAIDERGVSVDILWGQDEEGGDPRRSAAHLVAKLVEDPRLKPYGDRLALHRHSTKSHAKILLADVDGEGQFMGVVGSCNWLASGYDSYEASICLREPAIVRDLVNCLVDLAQARSGVLTSLASDLYGIAAALKRRAATSRPNARAALVFSATHNELMLRARDEARQRILVASHRLGRSGRPGALIPLVEACREGQVKAEAHYGRLHQIREAEQSQWADAAATLGVKLRPVAHPRLHAKVLAWDDNALVVTSLNWLSADPGEFGIARELGVYLDGPGVAKGLFESVTKWA